MIQIYHYKGRVINNSVLKGLEYVYKCIYG